MGKAPRLPAGQPVSVWDQAAVLKAFDARGIKHIHARLVWGALARNPRWRSWDDVLWPSDLARDAMDVLRAAFAVYTTQVANEVESDSTLKLGVRLADGQVVEAVLLFYDGRCSLCVSSQVGCAMGCAFCATGTLGFRGNLTAGEILEQLQHARARALCRNVVFMGMGEPLNNFVAVTAAARAMIDPTLFGLSPTRVTISTVGIVPGIRQLAAEGPAVNLALSLHAATQAQREAIMPAARAFPLDDVLAAMEHIDHVMFEYILLDGVNDSEADARALGTLLAGRPGVVNLIPYNTVQNLPFSRSTPMATARFHAVLVEEFGRRTYVRRTMGSDKASACGQLAASTDVEDLFGTGRTPARNRARTTTGGRAKGTRPLPPPGRRWPPLAKASITWLAVLLAAGAVAVALVVASPVALGRGR